MVLDYVTLGNEQMILLGQYCKLSNVSKIMQEKIYHTIFLL